VRCFSGGGACENGGVRWVRIGKRDLGKASYTEEPEVFVYMI
jgi:hypothetical protein